MPNALRKAAPLLVLAGVALMPRQRPPATPPGSGPPVRPRDRAGLQPHPHHAGDTAAFEPGRGRQADAPHEIPPKGWKDILVRTWKEFSQDNIPLMSAGVTFYVLLAIFPALTALVSLYGLFADIAEVQKHLASLAVVAPPSMLEFVGEQMTRIATAQHGGLSLAFVGGLLLSIWSANGAMKAMITGLNIAYDETEDRGFFRKTAMSLALTLGFLVFGLAALAVVALPGAIERYAGKAAATAFTWITWPSLLVVMALGLACLYRYGPSRDPVKWRWLTWGSAAAIALWLAASAGFSVYLSNFGNYEKTYGSLGALIGFMVWVFYSAQVILLGAELNAEMEHQTAKDTTRGPDLPMGERDAVVADTLGARQGS